MPTRYAVLSTKTAEGLLRRLDTNEQVHFRSGEFFRIVPGHVIDVEVKREYERYGRPYIAGSVTRVAVDIPALGLEPLRLEPHGLWDPMRDMHLEPGEPLADWLAVIVKDGPRPAYEMEARWYRDSPENVDSDRIYLGMERLERGDIEGAYNLFNEAAAQEPSCIDAHVHLGMLAFDIEPRLAIQNYLVGVALGDHALGPDFDGVLSWYALDNRPFLRCLHGLLLCLWRLECWDDALAVCHRLLRLNPVDNQGARDLLVHLRARERWDEVV